MTEPRAEESSETLSAEDVETVIAGLRTRGELGDLVELYLRQAVAREDRTDGAPQDLVIPAEGCLHRQATIHAPSRTLICADCGVPLDPFDRLYLLADRERRTRRLETRVREARAKLAELQKEERLVKQRLERAREQLRTVDPSPARASPKPRRCKSAK